MKGNPKTYIIYKMSRNAIGLLQGQKFSPFDMKNHVKMLGLVCSDNKLSAYNKITRDDNAYIADCFTKGSDKEMWPGINKYTRVILWFNW